jgi:hypothetical protein
MDSTLAVQYTALEILGEVIHIFNTDPQGPPSELLEYYLATHPVGEEPPPKPEMIAPVEIEEREPAKVDFEDLDRAVVAAFNVSSLAFSLLASLIVSLPSSSPRFVSLSDQPGGRSCARFTWLFSE